MGGLGLFWGFPPKHFKLEISVAQCCVARVNLLNFTNLVVRELPGCQVVSRSATWHIVNLGRLECHPHVAHDRQAYKLISF